jgi:hypothetical protein
MNDKVMGRGMMAAFLIAFTFLFVVPTMTKALIVTNLAPGQSINLGTVIDQGLALQIGDKQFGDFYYSYMDTDGNLLNDLTRSNVLLTALANDYGFGVTFQQPLIAVGAVYKDVVLKYTATVTDPNYLINDIHLAITGTYGAQGQGAVGETVYIGGFGATQVGFVQALIPGVMTGTANLTSPQTKVWVQKDIYVYGQAPGDSASITIIDQNFSQIPEPSTVLLLVVGLLGVVTAIRRRRS